MHQASTCKARCKVCLILKMSSRRGSTTQASGKAYVLKGRSFIGCEKVHVLKGRGFSRAANGNQINWTLVPRESFLLESDVFRILFLLLP